LCTHPFIHTVASAIRDDPRFNHALHEHSHSFLAGVRRRARVFDEYGRQGIFVLVGWVGCWWWLSCMCTLKHTSTQVWEGRADDTLKSRRTSGRQAARRSVPHHTTACVAVQHCAEDVNHGVFPTDVG
jgi:hypothetical protein